MKDNSDNVSIADLVTRGLAITICQIIGETIMDAIYWQTLPRTPYYLRKKIQHLEYELITKTCRVNETIIIP